MMSLDKKAITGTTSQLALAEKLNRPASKNIETEVLQTNTNSFGDVKLVEGNWKDQLLNRGLTWNFIYLHVYFVYVINKKELNFFSSLKKLLTKAT